MVLRSAFVLVSLLLLKQTLGSRCTFPGVWHGSYFQLGFSAPLIVANSSISEKGECVWSSGSQYVVEGVEPEREGGRKCWRCMSIYRKHNNVIQYKESYCETYFESFDSLCMGIAGDSPMFSMIRRGGAAETCPFHGPHTFSYAKGGAGAVCGYPLSYVDSCSDRTQLQLSFQACTDVAGSEVSAEQLTCLAGWKEGSKHYLVGSLHRQHVYTDEQRYRCFVYEYHGKGSARVLRMAESVSATCKGLWSPLEGFRTFEISKVPSADAGCRYPAWLTGQRTWRSLSAEIMIHVHSERALRLQNAQDTLDPERSSLSCHEVIAADPQTWRIVSYVKSKCDSGFVCTEFTRTAGSVVTARFGPKARSPAEACSHLYFSRSVIKTVLLVSKRSPVETCPLSGRYQLQLTEGKVASPLLSLCPNPTSLYISAGCGSSALTVEAECGPGNKTSTSFSCHSNWQERGRSNLVLKEEGSASTLCLNYADKLVSLSDKDCGGLDSGPVYSMSETAPCLQALSSQPTSSAGQRPDIGQPLLALALVLASTVSIHKN